jgi:hypothetical protein
MRSLRDLHVKWLDWESYALFRNSRTALAWGDESNAISLLHMSLRSEPGFIPALLNLYTLEMQNEVKRLQPREDEGAAESTGADAEAKGLCQQSGNYTDAAGNSAALLETVWEPVNGDKLEWKLPEDAKLRDLTRVRAVFNYAAAVDYAVPWDTKARVLDPWLQRSIFSVLRDARNSPNPAHAQMLVPLQQLYEIMQYRRNVDSRTNARKRYERAGPTDEWVSQAFGAQSQYGLACFCAAVLHFENDTTVRLRWAGRAFDHLRRAIDLSSVIRDWAPYDPHLIPLRTACADEFKKAVAHPPKEEQEKDEEVTGGHVVSTVNIYIY